MQVSFQFFFDQFRLVVILVVIGGAHVQLGTLYFKQLLKKCVSEIWVTIRHNRGGHAMQLENMIKENLS
jgi:hypothetical protein